MFQPCCFRHAQNHGSYDERPLNDCPTRLSAPVSAPLKNLSTLQGTSAKIRIQHNCLLQRAPFSREVPTRKGPSSRRTPRSKRSPAQEEHPARKGPSSRRALCLEESPIEEEHPLGIAARSEKSPTRKSPPLERVPPLERRAPPRECPQSKTTQGVGPVIEESPDPPTFNRPVAVSTALGSNRPHGSKTPQGSQTPHGSEWP